MLDERPHTTRLEIKDEVRERFPGFNGRERRKIATILNRIKKLESKIDRTPEPHSTDLGELAAFKWVLEELEAMEH